MVKINPNNNLVFKPKMPNQDYIEKEENNKKPKTYVPTKTYVPKAPIVEDVPNAPSDVEISEADTPV